MVEASRQGIQAIDRPFERQRKQGASQDHTDSARPTDGRWRAGWPYQRKHRDELRPRFRGFDPPTPLWN
jgi:hypothetical protein